MTDKEIRIKRLKDHGYNPIHLFGDWYLVRMFPHKKFYHILQEIVDESTGAW